MIILLKRCCYAFRFMRGAGNNDQKQGNLAAVIISLLISAIVI